MCIHGVFVALELKASASDKPTELQKYNLGRISQAKGIALLVYPENWDEVYAHLHKIAETGRIPKANEKIHVAEA
jgi:hypothetical protein